MEEFLDSYFAPFTVEELVQADVLLGEAEDLARDRWTRAAQEVKRARVEFERSTDPHAAYGINLGEANLMALTLVSAEAAERVEELRARGWRLHEAVSPAEQKRLDRLREQEQRRWEKQRALLMRDLGRESAEES